MNRIQVAAVRGSWKANAGTPSGTALFITEVLDEAPVIVLPAILTEAIYVNSARNLTGTTQSQNSNAVSYAQGFVKSQALPVSRTVAVYRRDTKELLVSGVSGANGFFRLSWKGYSGKVAVVVFDDEAVGYNAKVLDLIVTN